jgi:hypothetical protein
MIIIDSLFKFKCFLAERAEQFSLWRGRGEPLSFLLREASPGGRFLPEPFLTAENFALGLLRSARWQLH